MPAESWLHCSPVSRKHYDQEKDLNDMRDPSDSYDGNDHQKVWEALPWYVNGTLEVGEHEFVARHLLRCRSCADEVARCRSIATAVHDSEEAAMAPSPEHFARLMARVDHGSMPAAALKRRRIRVREWIEKIRSAFQETPSFSRWALVAQAAAICLLAATLTWQASVAPSLLYQTLSDAGSGTAPARVHLQVVFADDITEREIRTLLGSIGATIVAGPSPMAVYTVALTADDGATSAQTQEQLALLRSHPKVRLAEAKQPR
jgi:hypothetical protein